jgi:uncharacterized protein (TIGR01777 family)
MKTEKQILITGGSGMIGSWLTAMLIQKGYGVAHLGRSKRKDGIKTFKWDPRKGEIENGALKDIDVIIHLAGAGIAEKRWTDRWKKEILSSRTETTLLLKKTLEAEPNHVSVFISSSGINYYGLDEEEKAWRESDASGKDFMARVCVAWEREVINLTSNSLRTVILRTGVVLSRDSVALSRLAMPVRFFVGAPLSSGKQYFNWVHIADLCRMYIKGIEDESMTGVYNAVAPQPITNRLLTKKIASTLNRPLWMPAVPGFVVRTIAGGVAEVVLAGGKVSSQKIESSGFQFQFQTIDSALQDVLVEHGRPE